MRCSKSARKTRIVTTLTKHNRDRDRGKDLQKKKLTMTECIIALIIAIACVALIAVNLVLNIEGIVERGVSDQFMGYLTCFTDHYIS